MAGSAARKAVVERDDTRALYDAIGRFLADHRLGCDPGHYAFAHRVLSEPDAPLARTVAALTEGGIRLTEQDVATLGGAAASASELARAAELIAQARAQMDSFSGLVARMRVETSGFGRELAASVDALDGSAGAPDILALTATMLGRVREAEARLADATTEAASLRADLQEARVDARADPLTGLANRRGLDEAFGAHDRARCLAICDVDYFKQVNDRFGHAVGDRVLAAIAGTLAQACPGALAARYGGEEFALLFEHADIAEAIRAVDRARAEVAGKRYRLRDTDTVLGTITFSAGVVTTLAGESLADALARADALLYRAKHAGRNQVAA